MWKGHASHWRHWSKKTRHTTVTLSKKNAFVSTIAAFHAWCQRINLFQPWCYLLVCLCCRLFNNGKMVKPYPCKSANERHSISAPRTALVVIAVLHQCHSLLDNNLFSLNARWRWRGCFCFVLPCQHLLYIIRLTEHHYPSVKDIQSKSQEHFCRML